MEAERLQDFPVGTEENVRMADEFRKAFIAARRFRISS